MELQSLLEMLTTYVRTSSCGRTISECETLLHVAGYLGALDIEEADEYIANLISISTELYQFGNKILAIPNNYILEYPKTYTITDLMGIYERVVNVEDLGNLKIDVRNYIIKPNYTYDQLINRQGLPYNSF